MALYTGQVLIYSTTVVLLVIINEISPVTSVFSNISCNTINTLGIWRKEEYITIKNATSCNIQHCPIGCLCTFGNGTFETSCNSTKSSATIILPKDVSTMLFNNIPLHSVDVFAFKDIGNEWTTLYLNNNSLTSLQPGVFRGLSKVEYLYLYSNELSELNPDAFEGLTSLIVLDLRINNISTLQPDVFRGLTTLQELDLELNLLVELLPDMFRGLVSVLEIDIDDNLLEKVHFNAFRGLKSLVELDIDINVINELQPGVFDGLSTIEEIELDVNRLTKIPNDLFAGLHRMESLTLSDNLLQELDPIVLTGLNSLKELHLSYNKLTELHPELLRSAPDLQILYIDYNNFGDLHPDVFQNLTHLKTLSLAETNLASLPLGIFQDLHTLEFLNISGNNLNRMPPELLQHFTSLVTLDITHNPLDWINKESFEALTKPSTIVYVDEYATCCFIDKARCSFESPPSPFISCKRLLPYSFLRVVIWFMCIGSITGNAAVLIMRYKQTSERRATVQLLLITNLAMSDILTGIYLLILLFVDLHYTEFFPSHSESWRHSVLCRIAGALSVLSSEHSVFLITLISCDRFMSIKFPFSNARLGTKSVRIVLVILWGIAFVISISSILIPVFSPNLYDVSEICVGLPISRVNSYATVEKSFTLNTSSVEKHLNVGHAVEAVFLGSTSSMFFSIAIFTVLNLICFLIVGYSYVMIFITAQQASRIRGQGSRDREIRRALKMARK